jgi:hypothetical protein
MRRALLALVLLTLLACGAPAAVAPTPTPLPTVTPAPTVAPSVTPAPTVPPTPAATLSPQAEREARYLALAQGGIVTPLVRPGLPAGEWAASSLLPGEVQITLPLSVGGDSAQTVRLGKLAIAQVVKALFDGTSELTRVNVIGTTPGVDGGELAAISTVVERAAFARWDGTAEHLGPWQVSGRLQ